ncbi:acyltransferase [Bacteroides zhangwenhongii]|uniref:acyltransferase n=1 Tax=Bacteroides zhangwenhongii TaxID=2650157 RepID=UPI003AACE0FE
MVDSKLLQRNSSMELLRIVSMLFIMGLHFLMVFDFPRYEDSIKAPLNTFVYFLLESLTIIAVNVFVMLSGWFGIKPKKKSFCSLCFEVAFYGIMLFIIEVFLHNGQNITIKGIKHLLLGGPDDFWFVKAYILLYCLTPVLNTFVQNTSRDTFKKVLVAFFVFQSIYGWFLLATRWFAGGYSTISFIGLYLLARYMSIYKPKFVQFRLSVDVLIFICLILLSTFWSFVFCRHNIFLYDLAFVYTSPMVILSAAYLIIIFSKISFRSRFINWVAMSAFAVYLFHYNPLIYNYYCDLAIWCDNRGTIKVLFFPMAIVLVFVFVVLIDQARKYLWKKISIRLF